MDGIRRPMRPAIIPDIVHEIEEEPVYVPPPPPVVHIEPAPVVVHRVEEPIRRVEYIRAPSPPKRVETVRLAPQVVQGETRVIRGEPRVISISGVPTNQAVNPNRHMSFGDQQPHDSRIVHQAPTMHTSSNVIRREPIVRQEFITQGSPVIQSHNVHSESQRAPTMHTSNNVIRREPIVRQGSPVKQGYNVNSSKPQVVQTTNVGQSHVVRSGPVSSNLGHSNMMPSANLVQSTVMHPGNVAHSNVVSNLGNSNNLIGHDGGERYTTGTLNKQNSEYDAYYNQQS